MTTRSICAKCDRYIEFLGEVCRYGVWMSLTPNWYRCTDGGLYHAPLETADFARRHALKELMEMQEDLEK